MKRNNIIAIIIAILFVFGIAFLVAAQPKMILFYSDACVHCQKVADFINTNRVKDKLKFRELEVSLNQQNSSLMLAKARKCGLDTSGGLGVPFFYDGKKCLSGDVDIIQFLKDKTK